MSMILGFICLAGAVGIFMACLPKAVQESGARSTMRLETSCGCDKPGR